MTDMEKLSVSLIETIITICLSGRILEGALEAVHESGLDEKKLGEIESKLWSFVLEVEHGRTKEWWEGFAGLTTELYEAVPDRCGLLIEYTKQIQEITRAREVEGMP